MAEKVVKLFPDRVDDEPVAAKGSGWLIFHREWTRKNSRASWAFVFNHHKGLTAYEAWATAKLYRSPPFYECVCIQLAPFPNPHARHVRAQRVSVDTKRRVKDDSGKD